MTTTLPSAIKEDEAWTESEAFYKSYRDNYTFLASKKGRESRKRKDGKSYRPRLERVLHWLRVLSMVRMGIRRRRG
jgi:hypothetical protein